MPQAPGPAASSVGIVPLSRFNCRFNRVTLFSKPISVGMTPESEFDCSSSQEARPLNRPSVVGSTPVSPFACSSSAFTRPLAQYTPCQLLRPVNPSAQNGPSPPQPSRWSHEAPPVELYKLSRAARSSLMAPCRRAALFTQNVRVLQQRHRGAYGAKWHVPIVCVTKDPQ